MSDCVVHSDLDCEGRSRESTQSYESVWMAHWMRTSCDATGQVINAFGNNENICDIKHHHAMSPIENASNISRSPGQFGEIKTRTFEIMNESVRARNLRNEEPDCQSFPVAGACGSGRSSSALLKGQETSGMHASASIPWIDRNIEMGKVNWATSTSCIPSAAAAAAATEISSGEFHSQPESKFQKPMEQVKTHLFFRESSFAVSKALQGNSPGSSSDIVPYRSDRSSLALQKGQETSGVQASTPWIGRNVEIGKVNQATSNSCIPSVAAGATEISSREFHSQPERKFQKPMEQVKTHAFFRESSFAVSKPLQGHSPGTASDIVPYRSGHESNKFQSGRRAISSFMGAPFLSSNDPLPSSNLKISETEDFHHESHPTFLLGRQSINNHTDSGKSLTPYFKQNIRSLLPNDSSTNDHRTPEFGGEHLKLQNFSGPTQLQFPHQCNSPGLTQSEKSHHGFFSLQKLPHSVHDVETMRIRTSVDSEVGLSGGYPRFSQSTRSLLITKKTDVSLGKGKEVIANFGLASEVNRNAYLNLHSPSPFFSYGQQGVKIQSLGSSTDSEAKENIEDLKASKVILKNESSSETDIMDMDAFIKKHHISGVESSPSNKGIEKDSKPSQFHIGSSGIKIGRKHVSTKLPDINLEFCEDLAEPSSSRTQSLDMDLLLGNAEQTNYSISDPCPDNSPKPDPTERWIKRLKLSASDSLGMQNSNLTDFSHKRVNKPFNTTTSEPEGGNSHGKELTESDETTTLLRNGESSSEDTAKRDRDLLLSQSWIQRWLRNQAGIPQKEIAEPQSSKLALDDFQKKHYPSIGAMALMGKAMNGFQPCQIERRGSFVLWNSEEV